MELSPETIQHLAKLARLDLSTGECEDLRRDLEAVLEHARRLPPAEERPDPGLGRSPLSLTRTDTPEPFSSGRDLVRDAPDARGGFFTVPRAVKKHGS